jgi:hypothetical protein
MSSANTKHGAFGALCTFDLGLEIMGVHFRPVGSGDEGTHFIGCPIERGCFALGRAVKHVHERPAHVFGIDLERGACDKRKELGPDRFKGLSRGLA